MARSWLARWVAVLSTMLIAAALPAAACEPGINCPGDITDVGAWVDFARTGSAPPADTLPTNPEEPPDNLPMYLVPVQDYFAFRPINMRIQEILPGDVIEQTGLGDPDLTQSAWNADDAAWEQKKLAFQQTSIPGASPERSPDQERRAILCDVNAGYRFHGNNIIHLVLGPFRCSESIRHTYLAKSVRRRWGGWSDYEVQGYYNMGPAYDTGWHNFYFTFNRNGTFHLHVRDFATAVDGLQQWIIWGDSEDFVCGDGHCRG